MINRFALLAALVPFVLAAPAGAQTVVPAAHFDSVGLEGGGHVTIKYGAVQSVTILKGSTQYTTITVEGSDLKIQACNRDCPNRYDLEIEIVTPSIDGVAISGGGHIESTGDFPHQGKVTAAVQGGGDVDLRSIDAADASAAVNGGGKIEIKAEKALTAAVNGGGHISYWGAASVTSIINGGGHVAKGG